ncbi:MAG TPA: ABC transporter ATP-binding protein [Ignavibacteria bacterium]|nr:ABC transporter ATP-binding protein [Ignavibacteria bacterium]HMR40948.1 ABC transporter ATP-binding protein [Ignavibacteria bacterium]
MKSEISGDTGKTVNKESNNSGREVKNKYENPLNKKSPKKGVFSLVRELLKPYHKWLYIVLTAMLLETAMSLAAPWPLKIILDNVVGKHKLPGYLEWLRDFSISEQTMELAAVAAFGVVIIAAIGAIAGYIDNYYTESVAQYVANDLRQKIYNHLQKLSLQYYDSHKIGNILSTITDDVLTIQSFASTALLSILIDSLTIIGMVILMFYLNWDFALIAVGITPFLLLFVSRFKKAVKAATHEVRKNQSEIVSVLQQGLESVRSVKAFGRQDLEEKRLKDVSLQTVQAALKARRVKSLLSPIVAVTVSLCTAFVLWRSASLILADAMTIGALTVFLSYLSKFFKPVQDFAKMTNVIAQATVSLERVQTILDTDDTIKEKENAVEPGSFKGDIEFENVAFSYEPDAPVLLDINLSIKSGQRIGVCGPTGGGKSTLLSLIPRFYDSVSGVVKIDGVNVTDYKLTEMRNQIGFVLQDTVLFFGTVLENIAYGRPDATAEEIIEAAKMANAHEFISQMPHGYDTMVGERGLTLSGGQRQRLGIARAIIRNSPILILDEPTAALDTDSEKLVMEALERLMKGRTVITIAHRLSTIRDADKILVLKGGKIAENGNHDELMKVNGIYAELYRIQAGSTPLIDPAK